MLLDELDDEFKGTKSGVQYPWRVVIILSTDQEKKLVPGTFG